MACGLQIDVNHRRDVERQKLRNNQSAFHSQTERAPCFPARTEAECDRQTAHQRRHGGHHDRPETDNAGFENGLARGHTRIALRFESEIDHHDSVLFHDADEQDDADDGDDAQIEAVEH